MAVEGLQSGFAPHDVQGGSPLGAGLGQQQCAVREIERGKAALARRLRPGLPPAQAAGDHQVQHQPVAILQTNRNTLAEAAQRRDALSEACLERRVDGA